MLRGESEVSRAIFQLRRKLFHNFNKNSFHTEYGEGFEGC